MAKLKEEWKQIEGYPEYKVSNLGRVKKRLVKKITVNAEGYSVTSLSDENGKKVFKVSRLVYAAFVGKIDARQVVKNVDGNKKNNAITNLTMVTRSTITADDIRFIRANAKKLGGTMKNVELARMFGVTHVAMLKIVNGENWKDVV